MIQRYRSNKVDEEVDAVQISSQNVTDVAAWCEGQEVVEHDALDHDKKFVGINVPTLIGMKRVSEGDYLVRGSRNSFYPLKRGVFEREFELL